MLTEADYQRVKRNAESIEHGLRRIREIAKTIDDMPNTKSEENKIMDEYRFNELREYSLAGNADGFRIIRKGEHLQSAPKFERSFSDIAEGCEVPSGGMEFLDEIPEWLEFVELRGNVV